MVTDRFERNVASNATAATAEPPCPPHTKDWCGGLLQGVLHRLDYIAAMGFDALWITPVVKQVPWRDHWNGTGYHGYWAQDFFEIEPRLGTADDLQQLSAACKQRGMLLMLDVVANHVGPIHSVEQLGELGAGINDRHGSQLHQLNRSAQQSLASYISAPATMNEADHAKQGSCYPYYGGGCDYRYILEGWFGDLGDLNQETPAVRAYLLRWVKHMVQTYELDGLRLDTALYMPKPFLSEFQVAAGVYITGEVVTYNLTLHRGYQGPLTGLLNFPITSHLKSIFSDQGSLSDLATLLEAQAQEGYPNLSLLANFVDNHDSSRFIYNRTEADGGLMMLQNALAWTMLWQGIPVVYYGTEQLFVSNSSDNRRPMWGNFRSSDLSDFLAQLNTIRSEHGFSPGGQNVTADGVVLHADKHNLTFLRGRLVVMLSITTTPSNRCLPTVAMPSWWSGGIKLLLGQAQVTHPSGELCVSKRTSNGLIVLLLQ